MTKKRNDRSELLTFGFLAAVTFLVVKASVESEKRTHAAETR